MEQMQILVSNPLIRKDIPNKQFIGQKSTIKVERTLVFKHWKKKSKGKIAHNKKKPFYFLGLSGHVKVEYNDEEKMIPVVITECSIKDGALFINPINEDDEKKFTLYQKGPLKKLMDAIGIDDTQKFVGMELPCVNLIGYWTIDMEDLQNAAS